MELREKIAGIIRTSHNIKNNRAITALDKADAILAIPEIRDALECHADRAGQLDRISKRIERLADEGKIRSA